MNPNQRDIVEVHYDFPDGRSSPHMVIVLSCRQAIDQEDAFIGVVITDSPNYDDEFSFWIENSMLSKPLQHKSQIRLHLINTFLSKQIIPNNHRNQIKLIDFKELLRRVNEMTFGYPVENLV